MSSNNTASNQGISFIAEKPKYNPKNYQISSSSNNNTSSSHQGISFIAEKRKPKNYQISSSSNNNNNNVKNNSVQSISFIAERPKKNYVISSGISGNTNQQNSNQISFIANNNTYNITDIESIKFNNWIDPDIQQICANRNIIVKTTAEVFPWKPELQDGYILEEAKSYAKIQYNDGLILHKDKLSLMHLIRRYVEYL